MLRKLIFPFMAIAIGVLMAFGIREAGATECASVNYLHKAAEKVSADNGGVPYFFKGSKKGDEYVVWAYFPPSVEGLYFHWKEGQCKASMLGVPLMTIRVTMGEDAWQELGRDYVAWEVKRKSTGI